MYCEQGSGEKKFYLKGEISLTNFSNSTSLPSVGHYVNQKGKSSGEINEGFIFLLLQNRSNLQVVSKFLSQPGQHFGIRGNSAAMIVPSHVFAQNVPIYGARKRESSGTGLKLPRIWKFSN